MMVRSFSRWATAALLLAVSCSAQDLTSVVKQGEQVFAKSCATGYCHGGVLPASLRKAAGIKISLGPGGGGQRFGLFQAGVRFRIC